MIEDIISFWKVLCRPCLYLSSLKCTTTHTRLPPQHRAVGGSENSEGGGGQVNVGGIICPPDSPGGAIAPLPPSFVGPARYCNMEQVKCKLKLIGISRFDMNKIILKPTKSPNIFFIFLLCSYLF